MVISVEQGADDMLMSLPSHCLFLYSSAEWFDLLHWYTPVILKEGLLSLLGFRYSVHLIHVHTHICRCNSDVIVLVSVKVE